jgi:hypothetical protein
LNPNQRAAFILTVLGFLPVAVHGPGVVHHSMAHYILLASFLIGMLAFGWMISIWK